MPTPVVRYEVCTPKIAKEMLEEFSKLESEDASSEEAKKALEYKETCRKRRVEDLWDSTLPQESMVICRYALCENPRYSTVNSSSLCMAYNL